MTREVSTETLPDGLFAGLLEEEGAAARRAYLDAHPELHQRSTAQRLLAEVNRLLRVDLERAAGLAETIAGLAEQLADDECRAYALRAEGNVLTYRRDYAGSLAKYEAALELFLGAGDELEEGRTRNAVLSSLLNLGDYDRALREAEAAREVFTRLGDHRRVGIVENNLGVMMSRQDRWAEALEHYRSAHAAFEKAGKASDIGIALRNIAVAHQSRFDLRAALEAYSVASDYCEEHGLPLVKLEVDYNIAYLHFLRGDYTRAIRLFEEARASSDELEDPLHSAFCDLDQAELFLELNLNQDAARLARHASRKYSDLGMRYDMAKALAFEATAVHRTGQSNAALELLERSRESFVEEENSLWTAMIDLYRSSVLVEMGEIGEAGRLASRALEDCRPSGVPARTAMCEMMLARVRLEEGQARPALELCAAALDRLGPSGVPALEFQAHYLAGRAHKMLGGISEALDAYRQAHLTLERLRANLSTDETRISFLGDKQAVYESLVGLTLEQGSDIEHLETAFTYIETAKSRSLADLMAFRAPALPARQPAARELVDTIQALRSELSSYYHLIDREEMKGDEGARDRIDRLRESSARRERRLVRTLRKLRTADPEYRSLQDSVTADLESIRSVLPPGSTLLEYFIAHGTIYACIVDADRLLIEPVAEARQVLGIQRHLRLQLGKFNHGAEYLKSFAEVMLRSTEACLAKLHRELVAPIETHLRGRHLIVVPHGFLHHLPFHALHDGEAYLCDRFSVSYAPSASVFYLCSRKRAAAGEPALVLGVADERAPLILEEARAVAAALPGAKLLLGAEATSEALRRLGPSRRYLHIATHGYHRRDNPMFSSIQLGDAPLNLFDLYDLRLDAELAVLSGCSTGLGAIRGADELVGLTRGLLYAGAHAVLVTLWDVNDETTSLFMQDLYARLTAGTPRAEALRRAAARIRDSFPHPYYWAPFVLVGKPLEERTELPVYQTPRRPTLLGLNPQETSPASAEREATCGQRPPEETP